MAYQRERSRLTDEKLRAATAGLLEHAGVGGDFDLQPVSGGANNKVFRVETSTAPALLKVYFHHPADPRDRLSTEFSFCRFAWQNGVRALPEPLACDTQNRLGLYEFIAGRHLLPEDVTEDAVRRALEFYAELNHHKQRPAADALPPASEACFSLGAHLQCVDRRVRDLCDAVNASGFDPTAADFIEDDLATAWTRVSDAVATRADELHLPMDAEVDRSDRCLSPSDFGFHNAILDPDGRLRFIDFEYAGWDDPAKMVCDFFSQPALPVSEDYYPRFVETVVSDLSEPEMHMQRLDLLLDVYRIKWCCIFLNDFLPAAASRRRFAGVARDETEHGMEQLQKAREALQLLIRSTNRTGIGS